MDLTLFWSVFIVLTVMYFSVAIFASRRVHSEDEYFLGSRQFGLLPITFALVAGQLGAGMLLGAAEESYHFGWYGILYNLGICMGFVLLGCGFASKLRQFNISTTAELFETKYNSKALRKLASILSVLTLGGILAGQIVASRKLIESFTTEYMWVITVFWLVVIFYTMFGGLRAVVATDIFQVIIIILIFGSVSTYVIFTEAPIVATPNFEPESLTFSKLTGFLLMPIFFSLIEQDLAQRFFSAKTRKIAVGAAFFAGFFTLAFSLLPIWFGMQAQLLNLAVPAGTSPLLISIEHLAGKVALVFVVCAIIAAISSTADSLLCAVGSNLAYDFGGKKTVLWSRLVTFIVGVSALLLAYCFDSVLGLITQSYELSVSCLFVPILFCFFRNPVYKEAAAAAFILGIVGFILFRVVPIEMPREIATLALSLGGYLIVDFWAKKR